MYLRDGGDDRVVAICWGHLQYDVKRMHSRTGNRKMGLVCRCESRLTDGHRVLTSPQLYPHHPVYARLRNDGTGLGFEHDITYEESQPPVSSTTTPSMIFPERCARNDEKLRGC